MRTHPCSFGCAVATFLGLVAGPMSAEARVYAVGNDLWAINPATGAAALVYDITANDVPGWSSGDYMNSLAYDRDHNRLLMSAQTVGGAFGRQLYSYERGTGSFRSLGNLDHILPLSYYPSLNKYVASGGGTFYRGTYFLSLENTSPASNAPWEPSSFMVAVVLNDAGTAIRAASIYGGNQYVPMLAWGYLDGFGDAGDFTVNTATGELWGYSYPDAPLSSARLEGLWHGDLDHPGVGTSELSTTAQAWNQIAYDTDADVLYAANETALYVIDQLNGSTLSSVGLTGYGDASGVLGDLAVVPEPSAQALGAALGCLGFALWRRRSRS